MNPMAGKQNHLFLLEVDRENLVEDSIAKIVTLNKSKNCDPLTLPIEVRFKGEPGIDEGGVRKEYFELVMKELFSTTYGMFKVNEETQMYWFNGESPCMPLFFELVGTLMGIAMYNDCHIEVPLVSCIYKILLGGKPDFDDLAHW
jgi:ubiquitin-protein ligase E3 A